jgi:hypothetical protein
VAAVAPAAGLDDGGLLVDAVQTASRMWYPAKGDLRIDGLCFNFLPSWRHRGCGVEFGERWVFDPDDRTDTLRFMERTVHDRFPGLGIGSPDPEPVVAMHDLGNAVTPALAGCRTMPSSYAASSSSRTPWSIPAAWGGRHRFRFSVPDLEHGTPEGNLEAIRRACARER